MAELFIGRYQVLTCPGSESAPSRFQQPVFERDHDIVVDSGRRECPLTFVLRSNPSSINNSGLINIPLPTNEERH